MADGRGLMVEVGIPDHPSPITHPASSRSTRLTRILPGTILRFSKAADSRETLGA
jgi:hypothetical protein